MKTKLIALADALDQLNAKNAADVVDAIIKNADDDLKEWEDIPTKVDLVPMPPSVPDIDADALELDEGLDGMEIVSKLRSIFRSLPNPAEWDEKVKLSISQLMDRLGELI